MRISILILGFKGLSNGDGTGNGNENSKKAIGLGPVYVEVGDP